MRILLVQAPSVEGPSSEIVAPLGLGVVAAAVRAQGHAVDLIDLNLELDPQHVLAEALGGCPEVVGVGLRNIDPLANRRHSYLPAFAAVLETIKDALPEAPVVVGGAGFSMFPGAIMQRYPDIDVGVALEGELTFPDVLDRLEQGGTATAARIAGVAGTPGTIVRSTREDVGLVAGPPRPRVRETDLDHVRAWLPSLVLAYQGKTAYAPAAGVETKRGCPLRCSYCVYPALQGGCTRARRPSIIAEEVRLLAGEAGVEWVHFTDPVLNAPADHFRELCRELIARGVPARWTGFFREDVLTAQDAALAVQAGCAAFQFSSDGTCDATLARLGKGLTLDDVLRSASHAAATEALTVYHFMVNVPGTDDGVARRAHDLVDRLHDLHEPRSNLGAIVFNNLRVYPGTPLAWELAGRGWRTDPVDLLYPTYHDPAPFEPLRYELEEHAQRRAWRSLLQTAPTTSARPTDQDKEPS